MNELLTIVTGPAGAGRSSALRNLEDLGFETIDNIPLSFVPQLLERGGNKPLALGLDGRNRDFTISHITALVGSLRERFEGFQLIYLHADTGELARRYSETRRRHPAAPDNAPLAGILVEQEALEPLRDMADIFIDTTDLSVHDLRDEINSYFRPATGQRLSVSVMSFSYKRGLPRGVDLVFDMRYLRNPHWDAALRPLTGLDQQVVEYIAQDKCFASSFGKVKDLLLELLPSYLREGKSHLTIAFGCTGGRHRSVAVTESMASGLAQSGWPVSVRHRELERLGLWTRNSSDVGDNHAELTAGNDR